MKDWREPLLWLITRARAKQGGMRDLAALLGTTTQSLRNWDSGAGEPNKWNQQQIVALHKKVQKQVKEAK